jgi:hypothetical protein
MMAKIIQPRPPFEGRGGGAEMTGGGGGNAGGAPGGEIGLSIADGR